MHLDSGWRSEGDLLEKSFGSDDGAHRGLRGGETDAFGRSGVVEVNGDFARELRGVVDEGSGDGRRKQDADILLAAPDGGEAASEEERLRHRGEIRERLGDARIRHAEAERVRACHLEEAAMQRHHALFVVGEGVGVEFGDALTYVFGAAGRCHLRAEADGDGIRHFLGYLPEELGALEAEDGSPEVEVDGDDGGAYAAHHAFEAFAEGE